MKYDVFLSGPMSDVEDYNRPAFNEAAGILRSMGLTVFNPAEIPDGGIIRSRSFYTRQCYQALLESKALVSLPRWASTSTGGSYRERKLAELDLEIPVFNLAAFLRKSALSE